MQSNWWRSAAVAAVLCLALGPAAPSPVRAEPVKMRVAWIVPITNIISILYDKQGIAQHKGQSYDVELQRFEGSTPMITALATGNIEIALLGFTSLPLAVLNAGLDDTRVILDELRDGMPGYYSNEYMVRADGGAKSVAELKGKVLATNAFGSAVDVAMRAVMKKGGLDDKKDYTVVEGPFPAMKAMLLEKKVDLVPAVPPFAYDPALRKDARTLFVQRDGLGTGVLGIWVVRKGFLDKNRAALVDLAEDYLRLVRWYIDPANHKEAVEIAAKSIKRPPEQLDWLFKKGTDYYRDPNGLVDVPSLQASIDVQKDLGLLKSTIDVKKYIDMSIAEDAAKRIK